MSIKTIFSDIIPVITIDGSSGVGKGTVSAKLASHLSWNLLDSGSIYRLTALFALQSTVDITNEDLVTNLVDLMSIKFTDSEILLNNTDVSELIREEVVAQTASKIATYPNLRTKLLSYQRQFLKPNGLIADGRDMGTVVFPNASLKIFLTATNEERAMRRYRQLNEKRKNVTLQKVLTELNERDYRDCSRKVAPLEPDLEAIVIDTTNLSADDVFEQIIKTAHSRGVIAI